LIINFFIHVCIILLTKFLFNKTCINEIIKVSTYKLKMIKYHLIKLKMIKYQPINLKMIKYHLINLKIIKY